MSEQSKPTVNDAEVALAALRRIVAQLSDDEKEYMRCNSTNYRQMYDAFVNEKVAAAQARIVELERENEEVRGYLTVSNMSAERRGKMIRELDREGQGQKRIDFYRSLLQRHLDTDYGTKDWIHLRLDTRRALGTLSEIESLGKPRKQ